CLGVASNIDAGAVEGMRTNVYVDSSAEAGAEAEAGDDAGAVGMAYMVEMAAAVVVAGSMGKIESQVGVDILREFCGHWAAWLQAEKLCTVAAELMVGAQKENK
ncbi:hypothetical protein BGZ80_008750, partial [Entomortierella chlamydospora]